MTTKSRILVTTAAGKTGKATTLALLEKGYPVRAFVRRADSRANKLRQAGAEVLGTLPALSQKYLITALRAKGVTPC